MIFRRHHLEEERLFDCYLAEHEGQPMEPPAAEHLADCAACSARYADLRRFMGGLRAEADAELDEVFPAERLRAQQQQIARRLEHVGHPARVISFPGHPAGHHATGHRSLVAPRWLMGAAAAGLVLGIGLGSVLYQDPAVTSGAPPTSPVSANAGPAEQPVVQIATPDPSNDVDFLSELEFALERPYTPTLVALDELTPHVREVRVSRVSR